MNTDLEQQKLQILADPVAAYSLLYQDADQNSIAALKELEQQIQDLKKQHKQAHLQTKVTSRKIGEAKRNGETIDSLKDAMQEQSIQLRDITDKLRNTEGLILRFFDFAKKHVNTNSDVSQLNIGRVYPSGDTDICTVTISLIGDKQNEWNAYVTNNPVASVYHRAEWQELIQKTYGHDSYYFVARNNGNKIVGILPLIRIKSHLFGDFLVSMPYFKHGGAIADHPSIELKLMQAANKQAATLGIGHIEYRDDFPRHGLPVKLDKVDMILTLPHDKEALWKGFTSKVRSQIRRSQRENPLPLLGREEYLEDFYAVYTRNMRDLGSPPHSKRFIKNILALFPKDSWLIVIKLHTRPVAAGFIIRNGDTLEIPLASTIRDVNHLSINMFLYWQTLKFAVNSGFKYFNFGRSTKGSGTFRFKQQWGAEPKSLYWHYWLDNAQELPSLNPTNPKYTLIISIWKRLPVAITKLIGPQIVKSLP